MRTIVHFKYLSVCFSLGLILVLGAVPPALGTIYTGSLSTDAGADGLLTGVGQSWFSGSTLSWTVDTGIPGDGIVSYSYTVTVAEVPAAGISHMNVATSKNFTEDDFLTSSWTDVEIGLLEVNSGSSSMPSAITGIKFDDLPDTKSFTISFTSTRMPVWGDFYAKGGDSNELWNTGFGTAAEESNTADTHYDPTDPPSSGSIRDHLLIPDSEDDLGEGSLRIIKFLDLNENGEPNQGEDFLEGWDFLVEGPNLYSETWTTNDQGIAEGLNLTEGNYTVTEINIPSGWLVTTDNPQIGIVADQGLTELAFGNIPEPATITLLCVGAVAVILRRRRR